MMIISIGVVLFLVVVAIIAPLITTYGKHELRTGGRLESPSNDNWFGTDKLGRDVYTRTVYGSRISLQVGILAALLSTAIGAVIGLVAGYFRRVDPFIIGLMDGLMSIPVLLLAIALMALLGPSMKNVIITIVVAMAPRTARVARANVLSIREELYVTAASAIGAPDWRIMIYHVFPGTVAPLMIQGTYTLAVAILIEASLSFLGAGTGVDVPTWGNIISDGRLVIRQASWMVFIPGGVLFAAVLAVNLAGDGLRDMLDPKLRGSTGA